MRNTTYMRYTYGHTLTAKKIQEVKPLENIEIDSLISYPSSEYTITFDIKMAYRLLQKNKSVVVWGGVYKGRYVFIFQFSSKIKLPF